MNKNGIHFCNVYKRSYYTEYILRPKKTPLHYETDSILYCIWNNTAENPQNGLLTRAWSVMPKLDAVNDD